MKDKSLNDEIIITVSGSLASGKSTIIDLISKTLKENCFNVEINEGDSGNNINKNKRLEAIKDKNKIIKIYELQHTPSVSYLEVDNILI